MKRKKPFGGVGRIQSIVGYMDALHPHHTKSWLCLYFAFLSSLYFERKRSFPGVRNLLTLGINRDLPIYESPHLSSKNLSRFYYVNCISHPTFGFSIQVLLQSHLISNSMKCPNNSISHFVLATDMNNTTDKEYSLLFTDIMIVTALHRPYGVSQI